MSKQVIFVVEDDADFLFIYNVILKDQYEVHLFEEANDYFFNTLDKIKPDLVLLDWMIPSDNAAVVIETVKGKYSDSKVLVISALNDIDKMIPYNNADAVLQKPINMHVMQNIIKDLVNSEPLKGRQLAG